MTEFTFKALRNQVLSYALRKKLYKTIKETDVRIKTEFLLQLGIHELIPKKVPISLDDALAENIGLFLDWYFFEREERAKMTIAQLYVESEDFRKDFGDVKDAHRTVQKLKNPLWDYFLVSRKGKLNDYDVKLLEEESVYRIYDESTFPEVKEGAIIFAKIYPFGDRYYISGFILVYPDEFREKYEQLRAFNNALDQLFDTFIEGKNVKEKTKRKYEDMYFMFSDYVKEKGYTKMSTVKKINIDTWVRWMRKEWNTSPYQENECRSAVKQFLKFLEDKG